MTEKEYIQELADKWISGTISPEEQLYFDKWYNSFDPSRLEIEVPADFKEEVYKERLRARVKAQIPEFSRPAATVRLWPRIAAAASVLLIIGFCAFLALRSSHREDTLITKYGGNLPPGKNGATLTLSGGRQIALAGAGNGRLATEAGSVISKSADGKVIYGIGTAGAAADTAFNILSTARGQTYQVQLPDGTLVWLNAATTLKYPPSFAGLPQRRVELHGEAYFEVSKDKAHPFVVNTDRQTVQVLGTHFNINSYADEPAIATTLLEGLVRINGSKTLRPGEQADLDKSGRLTVGPAGDNATAWKDGKFRFGNGDLETVLRALGRWYDVDIRFEGGIPPEKFSGGFDRSLTAAEALDILEYTGVHFRIRGRTIIVSR